MQDHTLCTKFYAHASPQHITEIQADFKNTLLGIQFLPLFTKLNTNIQ